MRAPERKPLNRRRSSTQHYQTFATSPPKSRGRPHSGQSGSSNGGSNDQSNGRNNGPTPQSPLPKRQLAVLAMIALAEQTALNSISPYLPDMASKFPEVNGNDVGVYVGTIASAFALAQFLTNYFWGWLSDRVGRKPVILLGTILTAACFIAFGFCRTLWQAIVVQALTGMVNGNQGLVSTCLGEITDRSNQSRVFTYLPVLYGIGGITGPVLGGLLVFKRNPFNKSEPNPYPYLPPNLVSAVILLVDFVLTSIFLEESLDVAENLPQIGQRVRDLFSWIWQFTSSHKPTYIRAGRGEHQANGAQHDSDLDSASQHSINPFRTDHEELTRQDIFNRDTILLLLTYFIFALCNVSFNSLYPIFAQARPPVGRGLTPQGIGLSQGFAGLVTIIFQICIFGKLRDKMGNRWSYRICLFGFVISFLLMPLVGYKSKSGGVTGKSAVLAFEICFVLLVKTVSAVGGLTSALLLVSQDLFRNTGSRHILNSYLQITNSAPNHHVLGALNGLAQTLSAAGRAAGPLLSGGLFSLAARVTKEELLSFGIFGGVAFIGFLMSFGIRAQGLEAQGWGGDGDHDNYKSDDEENNARS